MMSRPILTVTTNAISQREVHMLLVPFADRRVDVFAHEISHASYLASLSR
jgi:hypothetical protein